MRVCVTGASGFIGRHVLRAIDKAGHIAIPLDVCVPWDDDTGSIWMESDITTPLDAIPGLDAVIHLAAVANPRDCDTDPTKAFDVNVNGTHQVLKMAWESGAKHVVFSSSAHVYGISPRYLPTDEGHPLWLQNNYTLTKILGEQLCGLYYQNHGLSYTTLRLYNAYGPGQAQGYFIPDMLEKAKSGHILLPAANTTKDFVHIDDVARAFVLALESRFVGAINIGTGVETTLGDIARRLAVETGAEYAGVNALDATRMRALRTRAKQVLGWEPSVSVTEGLRAICDEAKAQPVH